MKRRVLPTVLVFVFTWVAVGALDCGCLFASPVPTASHRAMESLEGADCHRSQERGHSREEETCCSGCEMQEKAPVPPRIQIVSSHPGRFLNLSFNSSQSRALGILSRLTSVQHSGEIPGLQREHTQGVPFSDTPIYLAAQSFLI